MLLGSWQATGLEVEVHSHCIMASDMTKRPQGWEYRSNHQRVFSKQNKTEYMGNSYKEITLAYRYIEILARHPFSLLLFADTSVLYLTWVCTSVAIQTHLWCDVALLSQWELRIPKFCCPECGNDTVCVTVVWHQHPGPQQAFRKSA